jgi:hypothetical protein
MKLWKAMVCATAALLLTNRLAVLRLYHLY